MADVRVETDDSITVIVPTVAPSPSQRGYRALLRILLEARSRTHEYSAPYEENSS